MCTPDEFMMYGTESKTTKNETSSLFKVLAYLFRYSMFVFCLSFSLRIPSFVSIVWPIVETLSLHYYKLLYGFFLSSSLSFSHFYPFSCVFWFSLISYFFQLICLFGVLETWAKRLHHKNCISSWTDLYSRLCRYAEMPTDYMAE